MNEVDRERYRFGRVAAQGRNFDPFARHEEPVWVSYDMLDSEWEQFPEDDTSVQHEPTVEGGY